MNQSKSDGIGVLVAIFLVALFVCALDFYNAYKRKSKNGYTRVPTDEDMGTRV